MNTFSDTALFLIAILPNPRDFEIARLLGWYRIPLRMAPKMIEVDYLAFYQCGNFGEAHRWRIEHFAEVQGHELTTRAALLREEPHHPRSGEEYFKIQLGPLQELSTSIPAGSWKRITFFYTLGSLMNRAKVINDLVVQSDDRDVLWRCLRERNGTYSRENQPVQPVLFSEEDMLAFLGQITGINGSRDFSDF